ncbi:MAG: hypothetical protein SFW67_34315 [Myxococcaceae bacterium]|nr:hypothetical protein [Myxococcaceae bacterium]
MNRSLAALLMLSLLGAPARADAPIARRVHTRPTVIGQPLVHPDAWETDLQACTLEFKPRPRCLTDLLLRVPPRLLPTFEQPAELVTTELTRWLGKDELANVFRVKERQLGEWMIVRHYVFEDSQGNVRLVRVSFRRVLGEWWLHAFRLYDREDVDRELGLD